MKKIYPAFIALALTTSACVHTSGYDEYQTAKNRETINQFFDAFNKHDFKLMSSYYADTAKFLDPSLGKDFVSQSHAQTTAKYTQLAGMFPNLKDSLTNTIAKDDQVITQFISTGTAADGKSFNLPICTVFKLKDGKIISDATYYDSKM
ncbi:nuclear transport factor 2 family protein [Mucilaginibacter ginkgonis]|uniref:Nuclear transport factor 2 family protein n=1 Tax=Mucilaginibacter ginkgonis TaxID=2682091 RepID=A0A6I4HY18_9SPHI|nr:nuclear transport factor 2 family protein [Mucilaginibacter ginkgonis]QQL51270.1 nuclear transport factor 2 family protein [Mucilaginibacter ginkgonis]